MKFNERLNKYVELLECTSKDLSNESGLSAATLSRYRSGERVPEINTDGFNRLCSAIAVIADNKQLNGITEESVMKNFLECCDINTTDKEQLRQNFNTLTAVLNINISNLCKYINYDTSTIFRIRNGSRQPSEPIKFAASIAEYISKEMNTSKEKAILSKLLECSIDELSDNTQYFEKVKTWLLEEQTKHNDSISVFLNKLNEFDLNEYIKAIHFDELKIPKLPFQLPTSKSYFGLKNMMQSELDFLKATVLSKSMEQVIMYSDMPMEKMAQDAEFPKKWMFGMAMMLKKGLHLNMIHNVDRPFSEMMLGLESYIPMYMTGQISPYYIKGIQNSVFMHFLKVSGTVALSGEAISGYHSSGKYYLTKSKDEVAYYYKRAEELLSTAHPLMDIYREDSVKKLNAFLLSDSHTSGKRRSILSSLPLYTMERSYLKNFLQRHSISENDTKNILAYADLQTQIAEKILKSEIIEDEIPLITKEEFESYPMPLSLSGIFYETDILYTYEDYIEHLKQTKHYAETHQNYSFKQNSANTFRNLQIIIHQGQWVMISKGKSPAIHFIIHHPKLREAIEGFNPPMVED